MKPRLLFFDLLRIWGIAGIVLFHILQGLYRDTLGQDNVFLNIFYLNPGFIGTFILIFVSGAVLEYHYPYLNDLNRIPDFIVKRLARIYPAYWMSLIIGLALSPALVSSMTAWNWFFGVTGLYAYARSWMNQISYVGWFIGLIVILYFIFPFLSAAVREYPYQTFFIITFAEIFMRFAINVPGGPFPPSALEYDRVLPIGNLLEFGLGIFIVQQSFYPKWETTSKTVIFLADMSFYIFLINYFENLRVMIPVSLVLYIIEVALFSYFLMLADREVQKWIKKRLFVFFGEAVCDQQDRKPAGE